jgi:hypothetical protein
VGRYDREYMRTARRGRVTASRRHAVGVDPEFAAAQRHFEERHRIRWTVTAFAAFFVMLALTIAVGLVVHSANAL